MTSDYDTHSMLDLMEFQDGERNLEAAIEQLLNVEKQMRLAGDVAGTKKAATDILQLCFDAKAWRTLNDQIVLLSKRRGQLKQVCRKEIVSFYLPPLTISCERS